MSIFTQLVPNVANPKFWQRTWREMRLIGMLMRDPEVPSRWKLLPLLVAAYLVFPIDLIPGFIPILGQLDDFAVLLFAINMLPRLAPESVVNSYREELGWEA